MIYRSSRFWHIPTVFLLLVVVFITSTVITYADPLFGPVTPENSIIGGANYHNIGNGGVIELPSGNIVIITSFWNGAIGAVTCLTPEEYRAGGIVVSAANSLVGSTGSDQVGGSGVVVLANGNYVVKSRYWNRGAIVDAGAVTWVNGETCIPAGETTRGAAVSETNSLVGAKQNDLLLEGSYGGVAALTNGHYVVWANNWDNGSVIDAGAVTWANGTTGLIGEVSAANSLVGMHSSDNIGYGNVIPLPNGNYVVNSPYWNGDSGTLFDTGAVTWGNGNGGTVGAVSPANSLVGSQQNDNVGYGGIVVLSNNNYVVVSSNWHNGAVQYVGAVTWGNGNGGTVGATSAANSLVGTTTNDRVGGDGVKALTNGHYVVLSPFWDDGALANTGAATWGDGLGGTVGAVSSSNSLVGTKTGDFVGRGSVTPLPDGNYVVCSYEWDNDTTLGAGAVTWANGSTGIVGGVSTANSLVGTTTGNQVGINGVVVLPSGNYVVRSPKWDNGAATDAGAATWVSSIGGTSGEVSAANSIVGTSTNDQVGNYGIGVLSNGNYFVRSTLWDDGGTADVGAITWGNGSTGTSGAVNATNSLVGSTASDQVSTYTVMLPNGHYVVISHLWDNGGAADAGAVTWANGNGGTVGTVSPANSLVGTSAGDWVGYGGIAILPNNNYVIRSWLWNNGAASDAGAATWANGNGGTVGPISAANSLVGSTTGDQVGIVVNVGVTALPSNNYVVLSPKWDMGGFTDVGAATWANGDGSTVGTISAVNSLVGSLAGDEIGGQIKVLSDGSYLIISHTWSTRKGAVTWSEGVVTPPAGVVLSETALEVTEGDTTDTYTVVLEGQPSADVTVTLTFDADLQARVGAGAFQASPLLVTFTSGNWATPQMVEIMAVDDTDLEGTENLVISHAVTSADTNYNGIIPTPDDEITVMIIDNENVTPVLASIGDRTTYLGKTLSFDVDADDGNLPAQTLTFSLDSGAPTGAVIDPVSGLFTWTLDETVTVGEYPITVTVTDDGDPALTHSETFTVTVEAANLVSNYGFENPGSNEKLAAGWAAIQLTADDRRMCDTETKSYAREGACAYRFSLTKNTTLKRTIQKTASKAGLVKNDTLELRGWVKATNLTTGARLSLTVTYNNNTTKVVNINLPPGTYDYQLFSKQVTLTRPVKTLKVKAEARKAKGTFLVDDIAVVKVEPDPLALSLPAVPDLRGVD